MNRHGHDLSDSIKTAKPSRGDTWILLNFCNRYHLYVAFSREDDKEYVEQD